MNTLNLSNRQQLPIAATPNPAELPITADSCQLPPAEMAPIGTCRQLSAAIGTEINFPGCSFWWLSKFTDIRGSIHCLSNDPSLPRSHDLTFHVSRITRAQTNLALNDTSFGLFESGLARVQNLY